MQRNDPFSTLRRVADYRAARGTLGRSGTWSLLFGALSVVAGCLWTPVDWVLTMLGVALLGTGVWNIAGPRPTSIVSDAITLLTVGAYNLLGAVLAVMDGLPPSPVRAFLGALQLVWSVQRLGNLGEFADAFLARPSDAETQEVEEAVSAVRKADATGSADTFELTVGTIRRRAWKVRIAGEIAVLAEVDGPGILVGTRATVAIVPRGSDSRSGALVAGLDVGRTRLKVTISADAFRLYEQWKAGTPVSRPGEPLSRTAAA